MGVYGDLGPRKREHCHAGSREREENEWDVRNGYGPRQRRSHELGLRGPVRKLDADPDPDWVGSIRTRLVDWYARSRRDLPWRVDRDPYRILVSEMMLVQTTVAAVVPYFERFLRGSRPSRRWRRPTRPR